MVALRGHRSLTHSLTHPKLCCLRRLIRLVLRRSLRLLTLLVFRIGGRRLGSDAYERREARCSYAVLDAVRLFLGLITACLTPLHGVTSPSTALWDRGKGLLRAWAPRGRCYTESHHRHYQELARLRHARAAGLVVDNRELVDNRFDTLDFSENQHRIHSK